MSDGQAKVNVEELIKWLKSNAGDWAGVSAANGIITVYNDETGETMASLDVDVHLLNNCATVKFEGPNQNEVAERFFIDMVDGGLDQTIEGRLNELDHPVEIGDFDTIKKVQIFNTK